MDLAQRGISGQWVSREEKKIRKDPCLCEPWCQAARRTVWLLLAEKDGGR